MVIVLASHGDIYILAIETRIRDSILLLAKVVVYRYVRDIS
jgi:hypothetical protein